MLGFRKARDWGEPPSFGFVSRGGVQIFVCEAGHGVRPVSDTRLTPGTDTSLSPGVLNHKESAAVPASP
jgi:hypothetical protein